MKDDLISRLRFGLVFNPSLHEIDESNADKLMDEAADALESQARTIEELVDALERVLLHYEPYAGDTNDTLVADAELRTLDIAKATLSKAKQS